ncbi:hypothetical protein NA57DRAFT_54025 [Rhizodiscina lignyota]|uniref:Uncharacterized protein n=1 Tax=Rhizodiscina lignyota TaxID=1504668 RepID=A0A9P4IMG0_9PEZI|nr:hypothetical protein NA57DRAFT_54025 [Rhizodiscina lignyota]
MTTFNFDDNTWYSIQNKAFPNTSISAFSELVAPGNESALRDVATNATDPGQQFQFFRANVSPSTFLVRSNGPGSSLYLGAQNPISDQVASDTSPVMRPTTLFPNDLSVLWNVTPWGDGYYYLTNYANGSKLRLMVQSGPEDDSAGTMGRTLYVWSSYNTMPDNYRFNFTKLGKEIDNPSFSFAQTPTAALETTAAPSGSSAEYSSMSSAPPRSITPASTTTAPAVSAAAKSAHGISSGAIAGISIGSVATVAILVAVIAFLFVRRRRKRQLSERLLETSGQVHPGLVGPHEMLVPSPNVREVDGTQLAGELPGLRDAGELDGTSGTAAAELHGSNAGHELDVRRNGQD